MKKITLLLTLLFVSFLYSQEGIVHKELKIKRVKKAPKIDGVLDDVAWKNANKATDFVMLQPNNGVKEPDNIKTEVYVVYDDEAIYFGAYLHDDKPEEIPMEFQTRDNFGNADFFAVILNPANDGMNQTEFFVMSTGNQNDARVTTGNGEDFSWNAVWDSSVKLVDDGWIVEMKIPYSALRFSNEKVQIWGLNFHRNHRKSRSQYSWNFIDNSKGNISQYDGIVTGIENIKPPLRLSINPFIFGSATSFTGKTDYDWSAGMDVKYGITDNFTLDATLVPDFGQVAFDDLTLNLSSFEQKFSDQRAFFTEGTELFNKGNFFYSRRIGNTPIGINSFTITANEEEIENPNKVDMLNAIKISGRTKKGLGIGVFNAITDIAKAIIKNKDNNTTREVVTEPFANYNVLVLDQQFNKNSSVSLVNTNVIRNGSFRDANVTGLLFELINKANTYGVSGGIGISNVFENDKTKTGIEGKFDIDKISGKHQYGIGFDFRNDKFDKNDLGFQRKNNNISYDAFYSYRILEPKGSLNYFRFRASASVNYLMKLDKQTASYAEKSNLYTSNRLHFGVNATTKKQLSFGANINTALGSLYDYYEPRIWGRYRKEDPYLGGGFYLSTDYSKRFAVDFNMYYSYRFDNERDFISFGVSPRVRINDKINVVYRLNYRKTNNIKAFASILSDNETIIYGNRDVLSVTNSLSAKYNFSTKSALGLSFRYFWSPVSYDDNYFKLENDGTLSGHTYTDNHDTNYNIWNVDLSYNWEFAPGSQLVALYRNQIFNQNQQSELNFTNNLEDLFKQDMSNTISLKLIYYLDYNQVKSWRSNKS